MISIDKISLSFKAQDEHFVHGLYANWDEFCHQAIENVIEEVLSSYDREGGGRCIDRLELNLGAMDETDFFRFFPLRLREELKRAMLGWETTEEKVEQVSQEVFVVSGEPYIPFSDNRLIDWKMVGSYLQPELKMMLQDDPAELIRLIQRSFQEPSLWERMCLSLEKDFFLEILLLWAESMDIPQDEKQKSISSFSMNHLPLFLQFADRVDFAGWEISKLIALLNWKELKYPLPALSSRQSEMLWWIVDRLSVDARPEWFTKDRFPLDSPMGGQSPGGDDVRAWIAEILHWLSDAPTVDWRTKKGNLDAVLLPDDTSFASLRAAIGVQAYGGFWQQIHSGMLPCIEKYTRMLPLTKKELTGRVLNDWFGAEKFPIVLSLLLKRVETGQVLAAETEPMEEIARQLQQGTPARNAKKEIFARPELVPDRMAVSNAGLVLLAPWFPRLFSMLGLLNEKQKDFKDMDSRKRAVFIIQRMVTVDDREYTEPDLMFNRVLTACPFYEPLPAKMELTEEETETVDSMLAGVKANWSQMGKTSLPTFQHSFIERPGMLEFKEEKSLLVVEPRSYDLLLDSLPWGFRLVRFPWLKKWIHVNWRENGNI